jgi:predicted nuclease of predicted toxin-antitoxin system
VPLRFLIDENLTPVLASRLGDALHVNEVGLRGASDPEVLAYAVAEGRVVMTNNADDFRKLMRAVPGHPGLAVLLGCGGTAAPDRAWGHLGGGDRDRRVSGRAVVRGQSGRAGAGLSAAVGGLLVSYRRVPL